MSTPNPDSQFGPRFDAPARSLPTPPPRGRPTLRRGLRLGAAAVVLAMFGGCAAFSVDGGFGSARQVGTEHFNTELRQVRNEADRLSVATEVNRMLAAPLTAQSAVRVALLNNPGLQATYARLGIAEADLVQAGRLRNPVLSATNVRSGGEGSHERTMLFDFGALLTMR